MRYVQFIASALTCAVLVAGCGELPQTTFYKQGEYRGKPDGLAWNSEPFKGDKSAWENALKARSHGQDEYARIGG
jgi:hypothetical protein